MFFSFVFQYHNNSQNPSSYAVDVCFCCVSSALNSTFKVIRVTPVTVHPLPLAFTERTPKGILVLIPILHLLSTCCTKNCIALTIITAGSRAPGDSQIHSPSRFGCTQPLARHFDSNASKSLGLLKRDTIPLLCVRAVVLFSFPCSRWVCVAFFFFSGFKCNDQTARLLRRTPHDVLHFLWFRTGHIVCLFFCRVVLFRTTHGPATCCNPTMTNFDVTRPHFCSDGTLYVVSYLSVLPHRSQRFFILFYFSFCFLPSIRTTHGPATCCKPTITDFNVTRPRFFFFVLISLEARQTFLQYFRVQETTYRLGNRGYYWS